LFCTLRPRRHFDPSPATPPLPGLSWRAITREDLPALVELAEACHAADGGLAFMNEPGNLRERYFPDGSGAGIGAFAADGRLVAGVTVHLTRASDTERAVIVGQVRPDLREKGIGTYLMRWSQVQAEALFTAAGVEKLLLQIATEALTESARRLYHAHGIEPVDEQLVMRRDLSLPLPDRPFPADVTIANWEPDLADQFFRAYQPSFRDRPGFPGFTAAEWIFQRTDDENFKPEWSLLARLGELPVGFLNAGTGNPGGFIVQIGVIPGQRRRGLGSALMVETMRRMQAAGERDAELTVNVNNPGAIQVYDKLGFTAVGRRARYERVVEQ